MTKRMTTKAAVWLAATVLAGPAVAGNAERERIARLEVANAALVDYVRANARTAQAHALLASYDANTVSESEPAPHHPASSAKGQTRGEASWAADGEKGSGKGLVGFNSAYSYLMLDHAENVTTRPLLLLKARLDDELDTRVTLGGGVTVIADYQSSNRPGKFGYLMRHPTINNQVGRKASEATVHAAQLAATIAFTPAVSGYIEMLYNPEQSFGAGTLTDINRNQVEVRKAFLLLGDLSRAPVYAAIGKMDMAFGLQDTVSPFTNSTNWHAFAVLAYGATLGYYDHGLHVRVSAIQGGAQFRSANAPVDGTAVPSRLNNWAVDANYTAELGDLSVMVGGSYIHGSAYCQAYPVQHFRPCASNVPAWAAYGTVNYGRLKLLGEFARTTRVWPGTNVPIPTNPLSVFPAVKPQALTVGARYAAPIIPGDVNVSLEFSRFKSGADGSPWERQNQWVAGLSHRLAGSVDLFGEYVRTEGWVPLNFLSGGNQPDGSSWSDQGARSNVVIVGVQAAF